VRTRLLLIAALFTLWPATHTAAQAARRDLAADERCGGHTLERHVGKTNPQLAQRLKQEPDISAASTYSDRNAAETTVGAALAADAARIKTWSARSGPRPNLALHYKGPRSGKPIGRSWQRGMIAPNAAYDAVVVLRWDVQRKAYCVLTSYPEVTK
jgi:CDI toxin RNase A-like protein